MVWALFSAHLPSFVRTSIFRDTFAIAAAFVVCTVVLLGFVYWQAARYMTSRVDSMLTEELDAVMAGSPDWWLRQDPRSIRVAGLFDASGTRIDGNIESLPPDVRPNAPKDTAVTRIDGSVRRKQKVRLVVYPLPNGQIFAIGRNIDEIHEIAQIVESALTVGLLPAFVLALGIGGVLSIRAHGRLLEVNRRIQRIVDGDLRERLPTGGRDDPFDRLAVSVNRMLDDIETLIREIAGVGDSIAHDLRTPLTRVRVRLERARANATTLDDLRESVDHAIGGLDQSLAIVTALLRIAEIENSRRLDGFSEVAFAPLVREVVELYEPIADDKGVVLQIDGADNVTVDGDRDLLFEAIANLVDNAVKFTPEGGSVSLSVFCRHDEIVIQVKDTGPGIPESEREAVIKRFYRSDKSRGTKGLGLGLSLVAAIVKLHGFRFTILPGPGCVVEIACQPSR